MRRRAASLSLLCLAVMGPAASARATCESCHAQRVDARLRAPAYAVPEDVHGRAGLACSDCHGGDPWEDSVRAHDLGAGFVGRPGPLATAVVCGRCHDGSHEVAPDVLLSYRGGRHALALSEGRGAATCTSCHGAHGIERPRGEPAGDAAAEGDVPAAPREDGAPPSRTLASGESPARPRLVAACMECHSNPEVMAASGLPIDQATQWQRSVHGRAVASGNHDAPDCASCHHPHENEAGLAAVRSCGGCHVELRAAFDRGPHAERFARLGFLDCAECHGNHDVAPASGAMLSGLTAVCTRCHGRGLPVFDTVRAIASHAAAIDRARAALPREDPRRREMLTALHALDAEGLAAALAAAGELEEPLPAELAPERAPGIDVLGWAKIAGLVLLGLLGLWLVQRSRRLT